MGLIFPPADLRGIIDKTAQFVAKNGPEFESRVMSEQNTARFAFLAPGNPYRAYYDLKLREFQTGLTDAASQPVVPEAILEMRRKDAEKKREKEQLLMLTNSAMKQTEDGYEVDEEDLKEPNPDVYTVIPPYIAPVDIDVIKTTAQFVGRNGQRFLVGLSQRERNNPQFDFLKPTHALFQYFTNLTEAYTKTLMPPTEIVDKLKRHRGNYLAGLPDCYARYKWNAKETAKLSESNKQQEEERAQMQSIEWHEFTVVETIEFTEEDEKANLAAPIDFVKLAESARPAPPLEASTSRQPEMSTGAAGLGEMIEVIKEAEDMEMDEEEEARKEARAAAANGGDMIPMDELEGMVGPNEEEPQKPAEPEDEIPLPPENAGEVRVVKDYVRTKRKLDPARLLKCPISSQLVRADQMSEHLRIMLLDPKWKAEKDRFMEKTRNESAFAPLTDVETNLASFVINRPDLFGSIEDI